MKDGTNERVKKRKSNRLRFKQSVKPTKSKHINENNKDEDDYESDGFGYQSARDESTIDPGNPSPNDNYKDQDLDFIEFGPSINGYRFIGKSNSSNHFNPRAKPINENMNTYDWSYLKLPQYQSPQTCDVDLKSSTNTNEQQTLYEYLKQWESIKNEHKGELIFPLNNPQIDKSELLNFYKQYDHGLVEILKKERIKWHPDKMIRNLSPRNQVHKEHITRMFQIVNELYEEL